MITVYQLKLIKMPVLKGINGSALILFQGALRNPISCDVITTAFLKEIYKILPSDLSSCYLNTVYSLPNPPWLTKKAS